jgi:hypothetical protein
MQQALLEAGLTKRLPRMVDRADAAATFDAGWAGRGFR